MISKTKKEKIDFTKVTKFYKVWINKGLTRKEINKLFNMKYNINFKNVKEMKHLSTLINEAYSKKRDLSTIPSFYLRGLEKGNSIDVINDEFFKVYDISQVNSNDWILIESGIKRAMLLHTDPILNKSKKNAIGVDIMKNTFRELYSKGMIYIYKHPLTTLEKYLNLTNVNSGELSPYEKNKYLKELKNIISEINEDIKSNKIKENNNEPPKNKLHFKDFIRTVGKITKKNLIPILRSYQDLYDIKLDMEQIVKYSKIMEKIIQENIRKLAMKGPRGEKVIKKLFVDYYGKKHRFSIPSNWISYKTFNDVKLLKSITEDTILYNLVKGPVIGVWKRIKGGTILTRKNKYTWYFELKEGEQKPNVFNFAQEINKTFLHHLLTLKTFDVKGDIEENGLIVPLQIASIYEANAIIRFVYSQKTGGYNPRRTISISPSAIQFNQSMAHAVIPSDSNFGSENKLDLNYFKAVTTDFNIVIYFINEKSKKELVKVGGGCNKGLTGEEIHMYNRVILSPINYMGNNCLVSCLLYITRLTTHKNYSLKQMERLYFLGNNQRKMGKYIAFEQLNWFENHFLTNIYVFKGIGSIQANYNLSRIYSPTSPNENYGNICLLFKNNHYSIIENDKDLIANLKKNYFSCFQHHDIKNINKMVKFKSHPNVTELDLIIALDYETVTSKITGDIIQISCTLTTLTGTEFLNFDYRKKGHDYYLDKTVVYYNFNKYNTQKDIDLNKFNVSADVFKYFCSLSSIYPHATTCTLITFNGGNFDYPLLFQYFDYIQYPMRPFMVKGAIMSCEFVIGKITFNITDICRFTGPISLNKACNDFITHPKKMEDYKDELLQLSTIYNNCDDGLISHMNSFDPKTKLRYIVKFTDYNIIDAFCLIDLALILQRNYLKYYKKNILHKSINTIQGIGTPVFLRTCYNDKGECITKLPYCHNRSTYDMVRESANGGRVQPFLGKIHFKYHIAEKIEEQKQIVIEDAHSLYPGVMESCPFPTGFSYCELDPQNFYYPERFGVYQCTIIHQRLKWKYQKMSGEVPANYFINPDTGKPLFPEINDILIGQDMSLIKDIPYAPVFAPFLNNENTYNYNYRGRHDRVLNNVDINEIRRRGGEVILHYGHVWKNSTTTMFKEFLETPKKRKLFLDAFNYQYKYIEKHMTDFKAHKFDNIVNDNISIEQLEYLFKQCEKYIIYEPNLGLRGCDKNIMNILSGALIMKLFATSTSYINNLEEEIQFINEHGAPIDTSNYPFLTGANKKTFDINTAKPIILGSLIYSFARLWMYETQWGSYPCLYCATDSSMMFYNDWNHFQDTFPHLMSTTDFCKFEIEAKGDEIFVIRNHLYAVIDNRRKKIVTAKIGGIYKSNARVYFDGMQYTPPNTLKKQIKPFLQDRRTKTIGYTYIHKNGSEKGEYVFEVTKKMFLGFMIDEEIYFKSFEMKKNCKQHFGLKSGHKITTFNHKAKLKYKNQFNQGVNILKAHNRIIFKCILAYIIQYCCSKQYLLCLNNDKIANFFHTQLLLKYTKKVFLNFYKLSTTKRTILGLISSNTSKSKKDNPCFRKMDLNLYIKFDNEEYLTLFAFDKNLSKSYIKKVNEEHFMNKRLALLKSTQLPPNIIDTVISMIKHNKKTHKTEKTFDFDKKHLEINYIPPYIQQ